MNTAVLPARQIPLPFMQPARWEITITRTISMQERLDSLMRLQGWAKLPENVCYLLCLHRPLLPAKANKNKPEQYARHYLGTTNNLLRRMEEHRHHDGARFTQVCVERAIGWDVVRLWEGGREMELILKGWKYWQLCPRCSGQVAWTRGNRTTRRQYKKRDAQFWAQKKAEAAARAAAKEAAKAA